VTIVVLDTRSHEPVAVTPMPAIQEEPRVSAKVTSQIPPVSANPPLLSSLLDVQRIVLWESPADREEVLETLVQGRLSGQQPI